MSVSKNRKALMSKFDFNKSYEPLEAIKLLKENSYAKFEESLEVAINLRIDSNKTDQNIRGVINLPKGTGKKIRVAVIAKGDKASEAKEAGADLVGDEDITKEIVSQLIAINPSVSLTKLRNIRISFDNPVSSVLEIPQEPINDESVVPFRTEVDSIDLFDWRNNW